jgi:hypothetical protein
MPVSQPKARSENANAKTRIGKSDEAWFPAWVAIILVTDKL